MDNLKLNPPARQEAIDKTAQGLKIAFPKDYVDFLLKSNGAEGPIGRENYLVLWPVEKLIELNQGYNPNQEFFPGLVFFGSDGGGEGYAFDVREPELPVVMAAFISSPQDTIKIAGSFSDFLDFLNQ